MSKPIVYMMCGVPGVGKTYFAKTVLMTNPFYHRVYVSSDDIREEICGDAADQSKNNKVFEIFYKRARKAIEDGHDVILDATHLSKKTRRKCRAKFAGLDCRFIAVQLDTPTEEAKRRNQNRDRVVPEYVMNRMIKWFQPVEDNEGFDVVWRVG